MVSRFVGPWAGMAVAVMAVFICLGTINAYVGAASRLAYSLARERAAPEVLARLHPTRRTPHIALFAVGGAAGLVLLLQAGGSVGLHFLLSLPNATFIGTYVMGSLAAVRLLKGDRWMQVLAWISLVMSCTLYAFLGWAALYAPLVGGAVWLYVRRRR